RVAQAYRAGVRIAFGTDAGAPFHPLGDVVHEMLLLHEAGLTPEQVLISATRTAAAAIRRQSELGTLEPGKIADLLVVRGNPLLDLRALADPVLVAKAGQIVEERRWSRTRTWSKSRPRCMHTSEPHRAQCRHVSRSLV